MGLKMRRKGYATHVAGELDLEDEEENEVKRGGKRWDGFKY